MRDFVETEGEHKISLNFHFNIETAPLIENAENGGDCIGEFSGDEIGSRLFTFDGGKWKTNESWISKCYGERTNAPLRRFTANGIGKQEFFTFILPADPGFQKPEVFETAVAGGRAFAVKFRDYTDLFVFADGDRIVRTEIFNTNFRFTWARMSADENVPEEFVLLDGSNFTVGAREVLNYPKNVEFALARRFGSKLNVSTGKNIFSVSLPQKRSYNYILKNMDDDAEE